MTKIYHKQNYWKRLTRKKQLIIHILKTSFSNIWILEMDKNVTNDPREKWTTWKHAQKWPLILKACLTSFIAIKMQIKSP